MEAIEHLPLARGIDVHFDVEPDVVGLRTPSIDLREGSGDASWLRLSG